MGGNCIVWSFILQILQDFVMVIRWRMRIWTRHAACLGTRSNVCVHGVMIVLQAINAKGGRYLEAQVQGSKTQAEEGTLVILAAGDRSLFDDCQSCFKAMGKNSFYLG